VIATPTTLDPSYTALTIGVVAANSAVTLITDRLAYGPEPEPEHVYRLIAFDVPSSTKR
jgi:hypothetical protein